MGEENFAQSLTSQACNEVIDGYEYGVVTNMSRWISIAPALPLKLTFLSRHNFGYKVRRKAIRSG